ncbi:hypothetical protein EDD11_006910 [Mortierella claussenii]|nr:hypothetical protein EDD11_006910 [Mortierella claussenii]
MEPSPNIELIQQIAHHLRDDRLALYACLLVSRDWSKAAVEYLYKAEHMMSNPTSSQFSVLSSSMAGLALENQDEEDEESNNNMLESSSPSPSASEPSPEQSSLLSSAEYPLHGSKSKLMAQQLLMTTLQASLLHDDSCSYDYISYLDKISSHWFSGLIEDWGAFCAAWRGRRSRSANPHQHDSVLSTETNPSVAQQEHSFNRLMRKVARRCTSIEEFQSSPMVQTATLVYAIPHFAHLTALDLRDSQDLEDAVFYAVANTAHTLSYIRLPGSKMKSVSSQAVADMILAQNKNSISQFKIIHGTNVFKDDLILKALGERHAGSLQRLTLAICDLEDSGLQDHGPLFTQLRSLNLEYTSGVMDHVVLPLLETFLQLNKLDLTETDCTHAVIQGLSAGLTTSHTVPNVADPTATTAVTTADASSSQQQGRKFLNLQQLILNNMDAPFTPNLFLPLADACPNLKELHMNSILADSFQDFNLFLLKMKQLRDLDIGNVFPEFTDTHLKSLVDALPDLRWLSVANTQITNEGMRYLAEHAGELSDLCILGCDQVTKSGLIEFLDKVAFRNNNRSKSRRGSSTGFRRLDITYCRLDDGAVAEIRERAKQMGEMVEVEGDEQFTDSIEEEEEEEDDDEGDDEDERDGDIHDDADDDEETETGALEEDYSDHDIAEQDDADEINETTEVDSDHDAEEVEEEEMSEIISEFSDEE